jgi:peptidoglycan-associated lipoprotein
MLAFERCTRSEAAFEKERIMTLARNRWLLALAVVSLVVAGCAKKKPETAPDLGASTVTTPSAPTEDVQPREQAEPVDPTQAILAGDLARVNEYLAANGLLGDVYFEFDKADLVEEARARLSRNADWLKAHPEFEVTIEGHCDERGTNEYNLALGERRAAAAKDYLGSLGVAGSRLRTLSYGEERPQCMDHGEPCWSRNRRAHFLVTGRGNVG